MDNFHISRLTLSLIFGIIATAFWERVNLLEPPLENSHLHLDVASIPREGTIDGMIFLPLETFEDERRN